MSTYTKETIGGFHKFLTDKKKNKKKKNLQIGSIGRQRTHLFRLHTNDELVADAISVENITRYALELDADFRLSLIKGCKGEHPGWSAEYTQSACRKANKGDTQ